MMLFKELKDAADSALNEILGSSDFVRSDAGAWGRIRHQEINIIQFQKHSSCDSYCVNLGVHYDFLPRAGFETPIDLEKVGLLDCELRFRLTEQGVSGDQWWPIAVSTVAPVVASVRRHALPLFDRYALDGPISAIEVASVGTEAFELLGSIPKVRALLMLSRIHERLGNQEKCVEAAEMGIRHAGMAVGPKKTLKDILLRFERRS